MDAMKKSSIVRLVCLLVCLAGGSAYSRPVALSFTTMSTRTAPPPPKTDRRSGTKKSGRKEYDDLNEDALTREASRHGPLEYLEDEMASREEDDPFHILLLGSTFDKPRITVPYVTGSLTYVLDMPESEAMELSQMAEHNGMSCLGTWERSECLSLGKQLQVRDIVCRVVPFVNGGQRGWQARDAGTGVGAGADF